MNKTFKTFFNKRKNCLVVASEHASCFHKMTKKNILTATILISSSLTWIFNKAAPLNGGSRFFHTRPPPHDANRYTENTSIKTPANLDLS